MDNTASGSVRKGRDAHPARVFDIRTFIALLIGIYGVVLVVLGIFASSDRDLDRAGGVNVNLWAGVGMVVVAALFQGWAMWRPIMVPDQDEPAGDKQESDRQAGPAE